jgi:hypothetical protein
MQEIARIRVLTRIRVIKSEKNENVKELQWPRIFIKTRFF